MQVNIGDVILSNKEKRATVAMKEHKGVLVDYESGGIGYLLYSQIVRVEKTATKKPKPIKVRTLWTR